MKNYHRKKNLYRILYLYFTFFLVDCTVFVSIKNQIEGDEEIAKELQNGNKSDSRAKNSRLTRLSAPADMFTTSISVTTKLYTIKVKSL